MTVPVYHASQLHQDKEEEGAEEEEEEEEEAEKKEEEARGLALSPQSVAATALSQVARTRGSAGGKHEAVSTRNAISALRAVGRTTTSA
jgi:hypothetical protein